MDTCPLLLCFTIYITTVVLDFWKNYNPNMFPNDASLLTEWIGGRMIVKDD